MRVMHTYTEWNRMLHRKLTCWCVKVSTCSLPQPAPQHCPLMVVFHWTTPWPVFEFDASHPQPKRGNEKTRHKKTMEEPMTVFFNLQQGTIFHNMTFNICIEQYTWFRVVLCCTSPAFLERPALQSFRIRASSPAEIAVVVGSPSGSKGKKSRDHNLRTEAEMKIAKLQLLFGKNFLVSSYAWVIQSLNSSEMGWE